MSSSSFGLLNGAACRVAVSLKTKLEREVKQSTCAKRVIVCALFDASDKLIALGSNKCEQPENGCPRIGKVSERENYEPTTACAAVHAEIDALGKVPENKEPIRAEVYGHEFACLDCEQALKAAGVQDITIIPKGYGTGLRADYGSF
jgi:deoxycytidylate deaminase